MEIAFLLHLYQPSTQDEATFRKIASDCYIPLIKLIKSISDVKFTLNMPLSFLEQLEKYGYSQIINMVNEMVSSEKIELTGSAAYHPLLTKIPEKYVIKQIILNEFGLGYYFGSHRGFEGEEAILIKNVRGFFPPELAVNKEIIQVLDSLSYEWVIVDYPAVLEGFENMSENDNVVRFSKIYEVEGINTRCVVRDTKLSNILSFKRDGDIHEIMTYIYSNQNKEKNYIVCLDGEVFGHHNKMGIFLFENLVKKLREIGANVMTISEYLEINNTEKIEEVNESSWGVSLDGSKDEPIYPFWHDKNIYLHNLLWDLQNIVLDSYEEVKKEEVVKLEGYETIPVWNKEALLTKIHDSKTRDSIYLDLLVIKSLQSDQFWWASNKKVYDKILYSPKMVKQALMIYKEIGELLKDKGIEKKIKDKISEIENTLGS